MKGVNKAELEGSIFRYLSEQKEKDVPCVFISYQRNDEDYAKEIAEYITSMQIDVFLDLNEINEKKISDPKSVTAAITKGLRVSQYMLVIFSNTTSGSPWVPFEIGYAYDKMGENLKVLRPKNVSKVTLPAYLKVKEILQGTQSLNKFLDKIRKGHFIYESLQKTHRIKMFSEYNSNPLQKYLDNE